ncbi:extensin-like [Phragmites australis]|uniref:extensin-like n=1 Tax=Phragmites australis TaxID=29695 RepID=UPI002D764F34|nr:extensin-like [Phragmites australis]
MSSLTMGAEKERMAGLWDGDDELCGRPGSETRRPGLQDKDDDVDTELYKKKEHQPATVQPLPDHVKPAHDQRPLAPPPSPAPSQPHVTPTAAYDPPPQQRISPPHVPSTKPCYPAPTTQRPTPPSYVPATPIKVHDPLLRQPTQTIPPTKAHEPPPAPAMSSPPPHPQVTWSARQPSKTYETPAPPGYYPQAHQEYFPQGN